MCQFIEMGESLDDIIVFYSRDHSLLNLKFLLKFHHSNFLKEDILLIEKLIPNLLYINIII